jgi:hypothetical protein
MNARGKAQNHEACIWKYTNKHYYKTIWLKETMTLTENLSNSLLPGTQMCNLKADIHSKQLKITQKSRVSILRHIYWSAHAYDIFTYSDWFVPYMENASPNWNRGSNQISRSKYWNENPMPYS